MGSLPSTMVGGIKIIIIICNGNLDLQQSCRSNHPAKHMIHMVTLKESTFLHFFQLDYAALVHIIVVIGLILSTEERERESASVSASASVSVSVSVSVRSVSGVDADLLALDILDHP